MNASMTISCPEWCIDVHDGPDFSQRNDGSVVTNHAGPTWGAFTAGGEIDIMTDELDVEVSFDSVVLEQMGVGWTNEPAVLRQVAADAAAAAEWLEARK